MVIPLALDRATARPSLVLLLWQNAASTRTPGGRRAEGDRLGTARRPDQSARPTLPAVPPIDAVTDSPGVRLAYRLPIDAASGWVSFTMAAVCLVWNTLVAIFVVQVVQQHVARQSRTGCSPG